MNDKCRAGVEYKSFPNEDGKSRLEIWPCFQSNGVGHKCPLVSYRTEDEAKAEDAKSHEILDQFFQKLKDNICPECDKPITQQKQVGRCVYASPCGHRLYQGRARRVV